LLKDKTQRGAATGEARYCRNLPDVDGGLLAARLHDSLAELLRARNVATAPRPPGPGLEIASGHLFWLDAAYTDAQGASHVAGGMTGRLELAFPAPPPVEWLQQAILGQHTGVGQRAAFGFGRYRLVSPEGASSIRRASPAASLLMQAREEENLSAAWRHIRANRLERRRNALEEEEFAWGDEGWEVLPEDEDEDELPLERLQEAFDRALIGDYRPPPLYGLVLPKADGGVRPLAIPPFFDRVLQRALVQVIGPSLESAQYRHSYGFRAGRSRLNARDAVQRAVREGYDWVYESDVDDFFDSVDPARLEVRLRSLYGDDPAVDLLMAWMTRPVEYQGQLISR
ncbi:MAG: CRISPR-associated endonuclease Cas1, partial [Proteobacteria bacterium]|nr:CRISPR-associated endonuclease Cas1 [Pseudomonadota bacterium]